MKLKLSSLCNKLPEDVVRYILSFDGNIIVRNETLFFIHKLDKNVYKKSYEMLLKKPLVVEGRTVRHNNEISTWCCVRLKLNSKCKHYLSYSSNKKEVKCTLCFWGEKGRFKQYNYVTY